MAHVLRRLSSSPFESYQPLFDLDQERAVNNGEDLRIIRRIGSVPLHRSCGCPNSWRQIIFPVIDKAVPGAEDREGDIGFAIIGRTTYSGDAETHAQIKELGGGIAPYENIVDNSERDAARSARYALYQAGILFMRNPFESTERSMAIQEPIPGLESPRIAMPNHPTRIPLALLS